MWNLTPLLPAVLLGSGAALCRRRPTRRLPCRVLAALLAVAALGISAIVVNQILTQGPLSIVLPGWGPPFPAPPRLDVDLITAIGLLLIAGAASAMVLGSPSEPGARPHLAAALAVACASALFVVVERSPVGLILGWAVLDIVLFTATPLGRRGLVTGQLGLLAAIVGLASLPSAAPSLALASSLDAAVAAPWLVVAAAIRMGLFPLWWDIPPADPRAPWTATVTRMAPMVAGACLALPIGRTAVGPLLGHVAPESLALLAVVGAGVLSILPQRSFRALDWATVHQAALVLFAAFLGGDIGIAVAMLLLLEGVVARAPLYLPWSGGPLDRPARLVLLASGAGLPPTLGFAARWLLYSELLAQGRGLSVFVIVVASGFAAAGTLRQGLATRPPQSAGGPYGPLARVPKGPGALARGGSLVPVTLLAATTLGLGIAFGYVADFLLPLARAPLQNPLLDAASLLGSPLTMNRGMLLLLASVAPTVLAVLVVRGFSAGAARSKGDDGVSPGRDLRWAARVRRDLELTAALSTAAAGVIALGNALHRASGLVEGRRAMALTLAATATIGLLTFGPPAAAPEASGLGFTVAYAVAAALTVALLLSRAPVVTVGTLAGAYVLVAAMLLSTGTPPVIAVIKLLVGGLVVANLAIGVVQSPGGREVGVGARRIRELRGPELDRSRLGLAALLVCAVAFLGVPSVTVPSLPGSVLEVALLLASGGLLAVVFARSPLRLSVGVFFALAAADLVYARIDPGLLITGGLAAFQLLLATVASYFVGMGLGRTPREERQG